MHPVDIGGLPLSLFVEEDSIRTETLKWCVEFVRREFKTSEYISPRLNFELRILESRRIRSPVFMARPDLKLVVEIIPGRCNKRSIISKFGGDDSKDEEETEVVEHLLCQYIKLFVAGLRFMGEKITCDLSSF